MSNQDSELQGEEREREALAHIRKEQELRTGVVFDGFLRKVLADGLSLELLTEMRTKTIEYLDEVAANPHVIKAAVPSWVTEILLSKMPSAAPSRFIVGSEISESGKFHYFRDGKWHDIDPEDNFGLNIPELKPAADDEKKDAE